MISCLFTMIPSGTVVLPVTNPEDAALPGEAHTLPICVATLCSQTFLVCLQKASVATERVSATLNAGQSVVLTLGLTAVLAMAASGGTGAGVTAGDLVCCSSCHHWSVHTGGYQGPDRYLQLGSGSCQHCQLCISCCHMLCHHVMC